MSLVTKLPHVLYVDADEESRQGFCYALINHAEVMCCSNSEEALAALAADPEIAVVVADWKSVDKAEEFLRQVSAAYPNIVNILTTAWSVAQNAVVDLFNSGLVWRAYDKTDDHYLRDLEQIINKAAQEHARRCVERALSASMLPILMNIARCPAGEMADRQAKICRLLAPYIDCSTIELMWLPVVAVFRAYVCSGTDISIDRLTKDTTGLECVIKFCREYYERFDGTGHPDGKRGDKIAPITRVLAVVSEFDYHMARLDRGTGSPFDLALAKLSLEVGKWFDPSVVKILEQMLKDRSAEVLRLYNLQS